MATARQKRLKMNHEAIKAADASAGSCEQFPHVKMMMLEAIAEEALAIADGNKMHINDLSQLAIAYREFLARHDEISSVPPSN